MKTLKRIFLGFMVSILGLNSLSIFSITFAQEGPYNGDGGVIAATTDGTPVGNDPDTTTTKGGAAGVNELILNLVGALIKIFIVIGVITAFIGGYQIMTSDKEESLKGGIKLITYGIVGIIVMVSASFIANILSGDSSILENYFKCQSDINCTYTGAYLAKDIYEKLLYPFIKMALYLVVGVLFILMAVKVITFIVSTDDKVKKKAGGIILWTVIGIFIILGSKQIVESVMGQQNDILNMNRVTYENLEGNILEFRTLPIVTQIINWVMGLAMFAVLVLIIIQAYRMFAKPDDAKNRERLKKTLLYVVIGVLVIGASSIISHVLVIK